jgi:hypothetical protein
MGLWSGICGRSEESQLCLIFIALRDIIGIVLGSRVGELGVYLGTKERFKVWIW